MRIPLELDDDILDLFKWTTFLDCALLGEDSHFAPPYTTIGETILAASSLDHYLKMGDKLQAWDLDTSKTYLLFRTLLMLFDP